VTRYTFDRDYYRRYYESPRTRIQGPIEVARLGAWLVASIGWYRGRLQSVLEVGAGTGLLRDWFRREHPRVRYVSTEMSAYACDKYGHERRDITSWHADKRLDLVVCQGVLPYLTKEGAKAAIDNLAAMTGGFLYLEAVTRRDHDGATDGDTTDPSMKFRSGAFYRRRLARHFHAVGGGLFVPHESPLVFWELERGRDR
jgi:predicted TPR repeat methyltransferase